MTIEPADHLTPELQDLMEHEKVIEQGLAGFIEVGLALVAIKADRKYRHAGYSTFDDYCSKRWAIGSAYRARLMVAAVTAEEVLKGSPIGELPMPEREGQVRPLTLLKSDDDKREAWAEAVESADGGQPTAAQVEQAVAKRQPTKKDHPAPFSNPILATIARHLPDDGVVVDPFAGTGRIHEFATPERQTIGIEIEAEWADKHDDTIHGDALEVLHQMEPGSVDAIATSPTYGNRMADHHNARDDSTRLTYKHTLGRDLADNNSGQMQWGDEYRTMHEKIWTEAKAALKPGGTFTINIKNHIRDGIVQRVAEWHFSYLMVDLELDLIALDVVHTSGADAGTNADKRVGYEFVATFQKEELK